MKNCLECGARPGEIHAPLCPSWHVNDATKYIASQSKTPMLSRKKASELLKHTEELINGPRSKDYGEPQQSFEQIAKLWSTYLHHEITVTDVGMMMILLKVARNGRGRNKPDNFVDICGYAALTGSECFDANSK